MTTSARHVLILGFALLCGCGGSGPGLQSKDAYRVITLDPGGGVNRPLYEATALNRAGVGVGAFGQPSRAIRYNHGATTDLGLLPGASWSRAMAINGSGQVVGFSYFLRPELISHACTWQNGKLIDLNPPWSQSSVATAINDSGQIVGWARRGANDPGHGVVWQNLQPTELPDNAAAGGSTAYGINSQGDIAGIVMLSDVLGHACVWQHGVLTDLDPSNDLGSVALAINDSGQIAGSRTIPIPGSSATHATLWQNGAAIDLGVPPGIDPPESRAYAMNNIGQVVGTAGSGASTHGIIYRNGQTADLNTLVTGFEISQAIGINDKGEILAQTWPSGNNPGHVLLLVPR